jgi:hypothetical protein
MADCWFLSRHGNLSGPFSLEQLRAMARLGQLDPADMMLKEGTTQLLAPSAVFDQVEPKDPGAALAQALPRYSDAPAVAAGQRRRSRGPWIAATVAGLVVLFGLLQIILLGRAEPDLTSPDLPPWFQRQYRIQPSRGKSVGVVRGVGLLNPPPQLSVPPGFSPELFEQSFTHYLGAEVFVYATPKYREFSADGNLYAGSKVWLGEMTNGLALICLCTPEGQPMNMYAATTFFRERAKGPPPPRRDID